MATPPQNPVPWIVRRAQKFGGRGPRPRQTLPSIIEEGGAVPRALEKELNLEHRSPLGGGGWAALLGAGEEVAWGKLLRLPPEIARAALRLSTRSSGRSFEPSSQRPGGAAGDGGWGHTLKRWPRSRVRSAAGGDGANERFGRRIGGERRRGGVRKGDPRVGWRRRLRGVGPSGREAARAAWRSN